MNCWFSKWLLERWARRKKLGKQKQTAVMKKFLISKHAHTQTQYASMPTTVAASCCFLNLKQN